MATKRAAGSAARRKSRSLFRRLRRKSKRSVLKLFANFVGKSTYKRVRTKRRGTRRRRRLGRRTRRRRY